MVDSVSQPGPIWKTTETATPVSVDAVMGTDALPPWKKEPAAGTYYPLLDTLRLYAGWLLAWYFVIFTIGSYQMLRQFPLQVPYIDDLFASSLILPFSFAAFLFLLGTSLHRLWGRGMLKGLVLLIVCFVVFVLYVQNI